MSSIVTGVAAGEFSTFQHTGLPSPSSIRLVSFIKRPRQLSPPSVRGREIIECILETSEIDHAPEFDVISSSCGDSRQASQQNQIVVDGKTMSVPKEICEAVQMIRGKHDQLEERITVHYKTELIKAAEEGRLSDVEACLRQGAYVHAQDRYGETAIHYACENGHLEIVSLLLDHGASIKIIDSHGRSPVQCMQAKKKQEWKKMKSHERLHQDPEDRQLVPSGEIIRFGKPIWIDAICVNQEDENEKASQKSITPQIYARARFIMAWTGVMDSATRLSQNTVMTGVYGDESNLAKVSLTPDHPSDQTMREQVVELKQTVRNLLVRPWFQRPDLVNEVALGGNIKVYCGEDAIPLSDVLEYLRRQTSGEDKKILSGLNVWHLLGESS
ncbi:hypothetical protein NW768_007219 [Fusarium equiseti]|uniref:Heterokaryon incompatibility domain-containing protein n=1 Tax=Fusarium equiseti TaxID=61235 RepID=A0ABQ8RAL7_FUSEQ|nr:hypothetical protein NW768_007219 [Fusarium equiseti]